MMSPTPARLLAGLVVLAAAATAPAEPRTVTLVKPGYGCLVMVDLGATLTGISAVTVRAAGTGGCGLYDCEAAPDEAWYDLDLRVVLCNLDWRVGTRPGVGFDVTTSMAPAEWRSCEPHRTWPMAVMVEPHGVDAVSCAPLQMQWPELDSLLVTVVAEAVDAAPRGWGDLKATYALSAR